jgi:hypothetical protein
VPFHESPLSLLRLIYTSRNAIFVQGARALIHFHDIVQTARSRNSELGIRGFLWFDRQHFFQVLEGGDEAVDALFGRIRRDRRHSNVRLVQRAPVDHALFSDWSMAAHFHQDCNHPVLLHHGIRQPEQVLQLPPEALTAFAVDFARFDPAAEDH